MVDLANLISTILKNGASDLHLTAGTPPLMRMNGSLVPLRAPVLTPADTRELVYGLLTQDQRLRLENELEIDFSYAVPGAARFRVNAYFQRGAMGAALRVIPTAIKPIEELGLPASLRTWVPKHRGLVLVTGPTGSGKSTTLASLLNDINESRACHILTVEDPIEFLHRSKRSMVNQREVGADTRSFPNALRSALRQDPDVILVGEMRDLETIQIALTAAETGHLVLATLHTSDAPQTIDRVIDVFPAHQQQQVRVMLANALEGICCQQLVPTVSGGRVPVVEVLMPTPGVRNLIRENKNHQIYSAIQTGAQYGMVSLDASLASLVKRGVIAPAEAEERATSPDEVNRLLGRVRAAS